MLDFDSIDEPECQAYIKQQLALEPLELPQQPGKDTTMASTTEDPLLAARHIMVHVSHGRCNEFLLRWKALNAAYKPILKAYIDHVVPDSRTPGDDDVEEAAMALANASVKLLRKATASELLGFIESHRSHGIMYTWSVLDETQTDALELPISDFPNISSGLQSSDVYYMYGVKRDPSNQALDAYTRGKEGQEMAFDTSALQSVQFKDFVSQGDAKLRE
jgi:hypothetical protein